MEPWTPILRDANARLSRELRTAGGSIWSADVGDRRLDVLDLAVTYIEGPDDVALAIGRALLRDRVYAVDGRRVCWARSWLPVGLVGGTSIEHNDTGPGGVPARLAELGHEMVQFAETVTFVEREDVADAEREKLGIGDTVSVARVVRHSADAGGQLVEVADMRMIASAYRFRWAWDL